MVNGQSSGSVIRELTLSGWFTCLKVQTSEHVVVD